MLSNSYEYSQLIKEQRQLKKAETSLKMMIEKINHELNQLVVEELQLKSRDVQMSVEPASSQGVKQKPLEDATTSSPLEINQQVLNLDVQENRLMTSLEESEDEL